MAERDSRTALRKLIAPTLKLVDASSEIRSEHLARVSKRDLRREGKY